MVTSNPSSALHKISEIYDRIAIAAVGRYNEYENLRKAAERVMVEAGTVPGSAPIQLYRNNTGNKGASYGSHENYLMRRGTPFAGIVKFLVSFFISRRVVCGRAGTAWAGTALRLQLVDLQYSDVRQDRGLYNRLAARGRIIRLTDDATVWPRAWAS
jgi:hypothetical protein